MKRLLCAAVVAGTAFVSVPAGAAGPLPGVTVWNDSHRTGVGTGVPGQLLSVSVDHDADEACTGFSYTVPFCVPLQMS